MAPGLKVKANTKLLEMQVEKAKDVDFALLDDLGAHRGRHQQVVPRGRRRPGGPALGDQDHDHGRGQDRAALADIARIRDMQKARKAAMAAATEVEKRPRAPKASRRSSRRLSARRSACRRRPTSSGTTAGEQEAVQDARCLPQVQGVAEQKIATQPEKKAALETEKAALKATLKAQQEIIENPKGVIAKAASGLKNKAGKLLGKALATSAGKFIARKLAYAIPILNVLALAWDIVEIVGVFRKLFSGAKLGFDGGDDEGETKGDNRAPPAAAAHGARRGRRER